MTRHNTPTNAPRCPDERPAGCGHDRAPLCGCIDAVGYQPPRTVPLPPPDVVVAARLLRAERATHMHRVDRIDEALRTLLAGMSPAQRRELDG